MVSHSCHQQNICNFVGLEIYDENRDEDHSCGHGLSEPSIYHAINVNV